MGDVLAWQKQDIEGAVRDLVAKHFGELVAHSIKVTPDTDHDGDPILRIRIMVEPFSAVTGQSGLSFIRTLRESLVAHNVDDFPIVSYISKKDLQQLTRGSR